jgi:hypothetical protein
MARAAKIDGGGLKVDTTTIVRIVCGALAVVVLFIIIWRRKRKVVE